ncbi:DNA/RNA non-specific endonuclease [Parendozoicomonas sp. Alg238-R29]|uniref:DNA/RNA non-specific endonuclease n=1 Tax=Parendozoicomonas sp. Alg238-R29 TaxID=2993446 RepID=UPI00248EC4AF|nr:DNA/RNA non-specific endonuclease [Parendozoicomonas sp. Alg238-R29]
MNGRLIINHKYKVGPYLYETDKAGRVNRVSGELDLSTRDRNTYQQTKSGKEDGIKDGLTDDDGGHLIASIFDGAGEQINYAPMNSNLNRGAWKKMENRWAEALSSVPTLWTEQTHWLRWE